MARPLNTTKLQPTDATLRTLFSLARIWCTKGEAAAVLGVHRTRLHVFMTRHPEAAEAWERGQLCGMVRLRELQYQSAMRGNTTMLIWLGKQWLGQSDKGLVVSRDRSVMRHAAAVPVIDAGAEIAQARPVPHRDERPVIATALKGAAG